MGKIKFRYCGADSAFVPVIVISVLDMLFSTIMLGLLGYIAYMLNNPQDLEKVVQRIDPEKTGNLANFLRQTSGEQVMMLSIPMVSNILGFLMGVFLLVSAIEKSLNALRIWFILTTIFLVIQITIFITQITTGRNSASFIVPGIFEYLYKAYSLWVVRAFIKEIISIEEDGKDDTASSEDTHTTEE